MNNLNFAARNAQRRTPLLLCTVLGLLSTHCGDDAPVETGTLGVSSASASGSGSAAPASSPSVSQATSASAPAASVKPSATQVASATPTARPSATASARPSVTAAASASAAPSPSASTEPSGQGTGGAGPSPSSSASGGEGGELNTGGSGGTPNPGGKPEPDPSDGCGKSGSPTGSSGGPLNAGNHQYYVKLPANYDAQTPYPVMMMFHPTGNPLNWAEQNAGYESQAPEAIRVYPGAADNGSGWQPNEISFFPDLYSAIVDNFCVDRERVFAAGESSGGEFVGFLGCEYGDLLRGVAPGAPKLVPSNSNATSGWEWDVSQHECKGNPTAIVIQSPQDKIVTVAAPNVVAMYRELNGCGEMNVPVEGFTDNLSNCVVYEGCMDGRPVYNCEHNDPTYQNSFHGWPAFAAEMTWNVFSEY